MSAKSDQIHVTPLIGWRGTDAICTLLEIGGVRLILDCGCSADTTAEQIAGVVHDLSQIGGVHAVLLTHADIHHIGSLPYLLGKNGLDKTPVFCTSPVSKFGQVLLYDLALNKLIEGTEESKTYDFDDVDLAFSNSVLLKFNQSAVVPEKESIFRTGPQVSVCAISSGRTIGGAIWRIRCGPTEIVYMVDINLKKEIMLDGVNLEMLPATPALLLTDAGSRALASTTADATSRRTSKKEKDDNNALITTVMDTMRAGGNVLIPTETAGRALELMQVLGKHWYDQKLGLYHLVFLSHMAKNVPEFARMQLEWMSDSLGRGFYNGKPNPFDLPQIRFATNLREIERFCPGPKTVLATDGSLSSGLAKELLLKWGGDPRCRVVFVDSSDPGSLAAELRQKASAPPVIATITRPLRVELVGVELLAYRAEQEKQRRAREEALQRKRRQEELAKVCHCLRH
jgi:cleavage and polyadenylation specificity factor subunit 2